MLDNPQAPGGPVDLLDDPPGVLVRIILGGRVQAVFFIECVLPVIVDFVRLEQLPFMLLVPRLAAGLKLVIASTRTTTLGRLGDITG